MDQRIGIKDSGGGQIWTIYNGTSADALPYADFNSSGTLLTRYVSGPGMVNGAAVDELLARTSSGGTRRVVLDRQARFGCDVVNSSGSAIDHVVYDSFGNITTESSASSGDRFKFAGMEGHLKRRGRRNQSSVARVRFEDVFWARIRWVSARAM